MAFKSGLIVFILAVIACALPSFGQTSPPTPLPADQQLPGSIRGTVADGTGAVVAGARVRLTREDQSPAQEVLSGADGEFSFSNIAPGPFKLTVTATTFAPQTFSH